MRFGVVLLLAPPVADEVDGLRRACGDPALDQVAPHITPIPPVNVRESEVALGLAALRRAAARFGPLDLKLGPVTTFPTEEHVAYLAVEGGGRNPERQRRALDELRAAVFVPPFERALDHDFVPHVTVGQGLDPDRLAAVLAATADYRDRAVRVGSIHLLEQRHTEVGRRWVPVADVALGPAVIVGRGGLPIELTSGELVDPEARAWLADRRVGEPDNGEAGPAAPDAMAAWSRPLVTVARRETAVVGVAQGWTAGPAAELADVAVGDPHDGTADHLAAAWWSAAADRQLTDVG